MHLYLTVYFFLVALSSCTMSEPTKEKIEALEEEAFQEALNIQRELLQDEDDGH